MLFIAPVFEIDTGVRYRYSYALSYADVTMKLTTIESPTTSSL